MDECVFCKIISGELPGTIIHEDEDCLAIMDIQPINPGHALIIPKQHLEYLDDLPSDLASHLFQITRKVARGVRSSGIRSEGINLLVADGKQANQEIPHFHFHVVPRYENDGFGFKFSESIAELPTRDELEKNAHYIRQAMEQNLEGK
jgi:histidine triad (HIT) family protein